MPRVFFSLNPDPNPRQAIASVIAGLPEHSGRPVPVENLHMTLLFLGSIPVSDIQALQSGCKQVKIKEFQLRLMQTGWWQRSQILWLGPEKSPSPLLALNRQLTQLAKDRGVISTVGAFTPHVTVMRKVRQSVQVPSVTPIEWLVKYFALMESVQESHGVKYRVIDQWPLEPGWPAQE